MRAPDDPEGWRDLEREALLAFLQTVVGFGLAVVLVLLVTR